MTQKQLNRLVLTAAIILIAGFWSFIDRQFYPDRVEVRNKVTPPVNEKGEFFVVKATDGDTIQLASGERVRYIGIDAPETVHPNREVECFGEQASARNQELVEGRYVRLEPDVEDRDRYGRMLRYVYADDVFVNLALVQGGFASAVTVPPNVKYQDRFAEAGQQARTNRAGLWAECEETDTADE